MFLRNETFFRLNRVYLICSGVLSFLIPLTDAEWVRSLFVNEKIYQAASSLNVLYFTASARQPEQQNIDWLLIIYLSGVCLFLLRFALQLLKVCRQAPGNDSQPYSFFKRISLRKKIYTGFYRYPIISYRRGFMVGQPEAGWIQLFIIGQPYV